MRLLAISLLMLLISSCATRQVQTLANLPLPVEQSQHCCWQALQQLDINYHQQHYKLTGVLAQTRTGVTLVLLDPFGHRLLSISKHGDALDTYRSPELPAGLPERFLLASSMLVWWPLFDWQALLSVSKIDWQLTTHANSRLLSYRGQPMIRATYSPNSTSFVEGMTPATAAQHERVVLEHQRQPLAITIVTDSWEPL